MTTCGISMVRDEADIVHGVIAHMAAEVDFLIVADNGSVDGTRELLDGLALEVPLTVVDDGEVGYHQSVKMSALAALAAESGADWIVPFDADELWYSPAGRLGTVLDGLETAQVCSATLYNHVRTALDVDSDDPFESMVWRLRAPGALPKVAFRYRPGAVIHQGNHGVDIPDVVVRDATVGGLLEIRHFPVRSAEHLIRKARNGFQAYLAAPDLDESQGAHWRGWGEILERHGSAALIDVFDEHWHYQSPIDAGLVKDPAPYIFRRAS